MLILLGISAARTFVQDGVITQYSPKAFFSTPRNGGISAYGTNKRSRVLYESVSSFENDGAPKVHNTANHTHLETIYHQQSTRYIFSTKDVQEMFSTQVQISRTDIEKVANLTRIRDTNASNAFSTDLKSDISQKFMSTSNFYSNFRPSYENSSSTSLLKKTKLKIGQPNQNAVITRLLSTVTYYGFAEFTTVVGKSVIIFSPSPTYRSNISLDLESQQNVFSASNLYADNHLIVEITAGHIQNEITRNVTVHKTVGSNVEPTTTNTAQYSDEVSRNKTFVDFEKASAGTTTYINSHHVYYDDSKKVFLNKGCVGGGGYIDSSTSIILHNNSIVCLINPSKVSSDLSLIQSETSNGSSVMYSNHTFSSSLHDFHSQIKQEREIIIPVESSDLNTNKCDVCSTIFIANIRAAPVSKLSFSKLNDSNLGHKILPTTIIHTLTKYFCMEKRASTCTQLADLKNTTHITNHMSVLHKSKENWQDYDGAQKPFGNYETLQKKSGSDEDLRRIGSSCFKNDIELIYRTLYTVYTYLTTYFNKDNPSLLTQTKALSQVLISELDILPTSAETDIYRIKNESIKKILEFTVVSKESKSSLNRENNYESSKNYNEPKTLIDTSYGIYMPVDQATLYTTYTFYTTIYSGTTSRIMLKSAVLKGSIKMIAVGGSSQNRIHNFASSSNHLLSQFSNLTDLSLIELMTSLVSKEMHEKNKLEFNKLLNSKITAEIISITELSLNDKKKQSGPIEDTTSGHVTSNYSFSTLSATLLLKTGLTTHTYYTTIYSRESTDVISHLETITTTTTETYSITPTTNINDSFLPITYYTTFTFWTKLGTISKITTISREETISNIVTPTNMLRDITSSTRFNDLIYENIPAASVWKNDLVQTRSSILNLKSIENSASNVLRLETKYSKGADYLESVKLSMPTYDTTSVYDEISIGHLDTQLANCLPTIDNSVENDLYKNQKATLSVYDNNLYELNTILSSQALCFDNDIIYTSVFGLFANQTICVSVSGDKLFSADNHGYPSESFPHTSKYQKNFDAVERNNYLPTLRMPYNKPQHLSKNKHISTQLNKFGTVSTAKLGASQRTSLFNTRTNTVLTVVSKLLVPTKLNIRKRRENARILRTSVPRIVQEATVVKESTNRYRRPRPSIRKQDDDKLPVDETTELSSDRIVRIRPRSNIGAKHPATTKNIFTVSNKKIIRPSNVSSAPNKRAKFTLRDKELTSSTTEKYIPVKRVPFRKPPTVNGIKHKRLSSITATKSLPGKRRLSSNTNSDPLPLLTRNVVVHRSRSSNVGRSRAGSFRDSDVRTRHRVSHDNIKDAMMLDNSDLITVTHVSPAETYLHVDNGKSSEVRRIVTARTSTEILRPQQYTKTLSANGKLYLALTSESTSINPSGATEVIHYILHEMPTTTITFTPTSIRGRKTSFSLILPSTVYSVESVISTILPQIQADTPLANILLSQLLLGNVGFPTNLLYGLYNGSPSSTLEYVTHTSTYVTTIFEGKSTILPLTFQGKKILTTIYDTTAQTITATEFITDTIATPSATANMPIVNSLLLQQLLFSHAAEPIKSFTMSSKEVPLQQQFEYRQELPDNSIYDSKQDATPSYGITNENVDLTDSFTERSKSRRIGKKHKRKHKGEPVLDKVSIITLFVSGRRPGEFSTVLSTIKPDIKLHKRQVQTTYLVSNAYDGNLDTKLYLTKTNMIGQEKLLEFA